MEVEIDLYSGRPNPRFPLEGAAAAELLRRVDGLRRSPGAAKPREGLGYRGVRIDPRGAQSSIAQIVVSDGVVVVRHQDGAERLLQDLGRELERWLIEAGAGQLNPGELGVLRQDIGT